MGSIDNLPCGCVSATGLERLRYFQRQLLTADDMRLEQEYFREKQRRHNRFLHGVGVVCGLIAQPDAGTGPLAIVVCPGYALGPWGDEIYVDAPAPFDLTPVLQQLAQPACANPGLSAAALESGVLRLQIRYAECQTRPVRTLPAGCGCDDAACEFSRIRDGFELRAIPMERVKKELTSVEVTGAAASLCEIAHDASRLPPFPPAPTTDWIQLATIKVKDVSALSAEHIDNGARRIVASTAQIQRQVIDCCCSAE